MTKRILVVEDQEDNRQIVRDLLTANDYEMTEAENGEEALAAVTKERPDLILMDIQLPVMILAVALVFSDAHAENSTASLNARPIEGQVADTAVSSEQICQTIELAARENNLPFEFLTHLIWQESRFNPGAVSRAGAQGIAQFMPTTAAWRGLENPFEPIPAIRKSAELLRALVRQFGNLGLAAAAYNAGSRRVQDWIEGRASLPMETQAYVRIVTGHSTDEWRLASPIALNPPAPERVPCPPVTRAVPRREVAHGIPREKVATVITQQGQTWLVLRAMSGPDTNAAAAYIQMQRQLSALGSRGPLIIRYIREGSSRYEVRVPATSRENAEKLCSNLQARGASCVVQ
jgi:CheY-like chemotaxis protein